MPLLLALAAAASAMQPAAPPAAPARTRPVTCLYDRLERPYLSDLWERTMGTGIPAGDPILANLDAAAQACQQQHGWPENMLTLASFYAMARAHADMMLERALPAQADRDLLVRAIRTFAPTHLDVLGRDGEGGFASAAKVEFRGALEQANPDLLRRFDYEVLWSAAMPGIVAEIMHAQFAFARDIG